MDSRRRALWAAMGQEEWQLRRGELLAYQGQLPSGEDDENEALEPLPGLWWSGALPGWLGDLLPILGLSAQMCHPLSLAEGKKLLCMVLLLPGATDEAMTVACQYRFDARLGKRALWHQLCAAGVVLPAHPEGE